MHIPEKLTQDDIRELGVDNPIIKNCLVMGMKYNLEWEDVLMWCIWYLHHANADLLKRLENRMLYEDAPRIFITSESHETLKWYTRIRCFFRGLKNVIIGKMPILTRKEKP